MKIIHVFDCLFYTWRGDLADAVSVNSKSRFCDCFRVSVSFWVLILRSTTIFWVGSEEFGEPAMIWLTWWNVEVLLANSLVANCVCSMWSGVRGAGV